MDLDYDEDDPEVSPVVFVPDADHADETLTNSMADPEEVCLIHHRVSTLIQFWKQDGNSITSAIVDLNYDEDDAEVIPVVFASDIDETLADSGVEVGHIHP